MNKEKGITLVSLVIYVVVMIMVLGVMSSIINSFYNNTNEVHENVQEIVEFNKFNSYFLREIKTKGNNVDSYVNNKYILFASGNSFVLSDNSIYYNNIKICDKVNNIQFNLIQDDEDKEEEYSIVEVTIKFKEFNKTVKYKLEDIY